MEPLEADCKAILKECGYTPASIKTMINTSIRSGDIPCAHPTTAQMITFLQLLRQKQGNGSGGRAQLLVGAIDRLRNDGVQGGGNCPAEAEDTAEPRPEPNAEHNAEKIATPEVLEQLAAVFGVGENAVLNMHRRGNLFSLIDVAAIVTGKSTDYAGKQIRIIGDQFPAVRNRMTDCKFPGERQRLTPAGDIYVVVELIMLLPGMRASLVRKEAASLFVRVYGGDLSLATQICENRIAQKHLAATAPDDPHRVFGQAVEEDVGEAHESESRAPPPWAEYNHAPHLKGASHLYALGSRTHRRLFKTGSAKNPWERLESEERKHKGQLKLFVSAVWWSEGHLEHLARRHLRELPPEDLGIQGTEYRMTSPTEIREATDAARRQHRALTTRGADEDVAEDASWVTDGKRRRFHLQVYEDEFNLHQRAQDYTFQSHSRDFELHKKRCDYDMDLAHRQVELEEKRLGLEERRFDFERGKSI